MLLCPPKCDPSAYSNITGGGKGYAFQLLTLPHTKEQQLLVLSCCQLIPTSPFVSSTYRTMSPTGGFGGFQAQEPQSAQIDESTPWVAAGDGDLALLQTSITQLGLSPNAADSNGFTFLHAACGYGRVEVIQWLLGLNKDTVVIDVNAKDGDGDTPLHHCDDVESAKMLIEAGADRTIQNDDGKTALEVKEEEMKEGDEEDDSDDEDRAKLKDLVAYLNV